MPFGLRSRQPSAMGSSSATTSNLRHAINRMGAGLCSSMVAACSGRSAVTSQCSLTTGLGRREYLLGCEHYEAEPAQAADPAIPPCSHIAQLARGRCCGALGKTELAHYEALYVGGSCRLPFANSC